MRDDEVVVEVLELALALALAGLNVGVGRPSGQTPSKWKVRVAARLPCQRCWERKAAASHHSQSGTVVAVSVILGQRKVISLICNMTLQCYCIVVTRR